MGRHSVVPARSLAARLPIPPRHDEEEHNAWPSQDSASALIKIISLKGCSTDLLSPKAKKILTKIVTNEEYVSILT
jgi:hypothetical protein